MVMAVHAIVHQAGFINKSSRGDLRISYQLRHLALNMMPSICTEDSLIAEQW